MTNVELAKEISKLKDALERLLTILIHYSANSYFNIETENLIRILQEKKEINE